MTVEPIEHLSACLLLAVPDKGHVPGRLLPRPITTRRSRLGPVRFVGSRSNAHGASLRRLRRNGKGLVEIRDQVIDILDAD